MGMYSHPNGPHPGASSSVRNAERLVQVKVRHITSIVTRATQPHLCVHVGPIHIDLPTLFVDQLTDLPARDSNTGGFVTRPVCRTHPPRSTCPLCGGGCLLDSVLKDATGGGVGDHDASKVLLVLLNGLLPDIQPHHPITVSVQVLHLKPCHGSTGWVRPVGTLWNEGHLHREGRWLNNQQHGGGGGGGGGSCLPLCLPYALQVGPDGTQPSVLSLCPTVGLEADLVISSDLTEVPFQLLQELLVALGLVQGHKGMESAELRQQQGDALCGRIELHGTGPLQSGREGRKKEGMGVELGNTTDVSQRHQRTITRLTWKYYQYMLCRQQ